MAFIVRVQVTAWVRQNDNFIIIAQVPQNQLESYWSKKDRKTGFKKK